ncbi:hypothetical protein ACFW1F_10670 [Streptomyces bungoensis]|uniref:hypothetical protein n=1 Tax=Streptomyces bungoensis TaxID=285568 RepID=UPI0036933A56
MTKFTVARQDLKGVTRALCVTSFPEEGNRAMDMQVVDVSPQLAAQWLTRNTNNRPLSKGTVQQLAAQIQRGEWQLTH